MMSLSLLQAELLAQHDENCLVLNQMTASVNDLQFQLANSQQEYTNLMVGFNALKPNAVFFLILQTWSV